MPTFTVRGQKVRTASPRRFVVVAMVWPRRVVKRSDNLQTARYAARHHGNAVIIDARTGQEV